MKIETKYNIDDVVDYNIVERTDYKETCHCCQGSGLIKGYDDKEYKCPNCEGNGVILKYRLTDVPMTGTIEDIEIHRYYREDCRPRDIRYKIRREIRNKPWYRSFDYKREEEILRLVKAAPEFVDDDGNVVEIIY